MGWDKDGMRWFGGDGKGKGRDGMGWRGREGRDRMRWNGME